MLILGHRGAITVARENTVSALRAAVAAGAAGSEFDVRMTTDGVCVCTHDANIAIEGAMRRVCELTGEEVAAARRDEDRIPTLAEALDALAGTMIVAEIKNHPWDECYDPAQALTAAVARALPPGAVVACFDPAALACVRDLRRDISTAVITGAAFAPDSNLDAALAGGHAICSVEHSAVTKKFVERAHSHGKGVYAWATDDPAEVRRLASLGTDALMCDDPARAIAAFGR